MTHCSGGPSTDQFDMLSQLVAKARGVGSAGGANADVPAAWSAGRTRPLCPYPKVARYSGSGDVEAAASFSCQ
jgi:hypothetical protein